MHGKMAFDDINQEPIVTFGSDWLDKKFLMGVQNGAISDESLSFVFMIFKVVQRKEQEATGTDKFMRFSESC